MPTLNASRILFRDLPTPQAQPLFAARPGLLLENHDYIEGDLIQIEKGKLTLSSVLFGLRRFDIASQALALVLKPAPPITNQLALKLDSHTTLFINRLESTPGQLRLPDLPLIPLAQSNLWQILRLRAP